LAIGLPTSRASEFFHFCLAVSLLLCLGLSAVLLYSRPERRRFSECIYAALSAVATLYVMLFVYLAVVLIVAGLNGALFVFMAFAMALPFVIALAFAGASLGYVIQKSAARTPAAWTGLAGSRAARETTRQA
jgi:hypothetical protein